MLVVFHGCVLLVKRSLRVVGGPLVSFAIRQVENTRAIFRYSRFVRFLFGGRVGSLCDFRSQGRFFSREALKTSSSVATRDLISDAERDDQQWSDRAVEELWIFVVKLLRAHGGCLGVKRR
jgi:hypothetical protein